MAVALPLNVVKVQNGVNTRNLNGGAANADNIRHSSVANGGYELLGCRIPKTEYDSFASSVYVYGAAVEARLLTPTGTQVWDGILRTAVPMPDETVTLEAIGNNVLLEEREQNLLWQSRFYGDWSVGSDDPFDFNDSDAFNDSVRKGSIQWQVPKGQNVQGLANPVNNPCDRSRIMWFIDNTIAVRRVAGRIKQNVSAGVYGLRLERWITVSTTTTDAEVVADLSSLINTVATDTFDSVITVANARPVMGFLFWRTSNTTATASALKVWITELRVSGNAYRTTPADWDVYSVDQVAADLADNLGWAVGATSHSLNILPLWWDEGTWAELMDYLAAISERYWIVDTGPTLRLRSWTSGSLWTANAFGSSAHALADIRPSDDRYTHINITYRYIDKRKWRHFELPTGVPFAAGRRRTLRFRIADPQKKPATGIVPLFVSSVASALATEYGTELLTGTITLSFATSGTERSSHEIKSGDRITISDWPGGAKTFRIYETDHRDDAPSILGVGRNPQTLERLLLRREKRQARAGVIQS